MSARRVRRKPAASAVKVTGGSRPLVLDAVEAVAAGVSHRFLALPADPTVEIRWEVPPDWDGALPVDRALVERARVKPVVLVPEELAEQVDRHALRQEILDAGALYCKVPLVHVARKKVKRDARHRTDLPLEESLHIFAEETHAEDAETKVKFAAALAREADAGVKE